MSRFLTLQSITTLLTMLSMAAAVFGKAQLSAWFANPETVQTILGLLSILGIGVVAVTPPVTEPAKK